MCNLKFLRGRSAAGYQPVSPVLEEVRQEQMREDDVKGSKIVKEITAVAAGVESVQALPAVWQGQRGSKRVTGEYMYLQSLDLPWVYDLQVFGKTALTWRLKLKNFPKGTKGGRELNADLEKLRRDHGQDHLLMEIDFPSNYPALPPFMRIVSPKTEWYTGFVSCNGALLLEPMTVQGWSDNMCIEDLLVGAIYAMVDCEKDRVLAGSVEGPGGETGPLRVHFPAVNPANVLQAHEKDAAKVSFSRMEAAAARNGFKH